ncbi:MAG: PA domain-containing protein [Clostridia bacterium]
MRTNQKAASVTFSSVMVFGDIPYSAVSAEGLAQLQPRHTRDLVTHSVAQAVEIVGSVGVEEVFANVGTVEDLRNARVAGKIAVVTSGFVSLIEQVKNAIAAGAVALVILLAHSIRTGKTSEAEEEQYGEERVSWEAEFKPVAFMLAVYVITCVARLRRFLAGMTAIRKTQLGRIKGTVHDKRPRFAVRSHDSPCMRDGTRLLCSA